MPTPRKPTPPTTAAIEAIEAIEAFCARFDALFSRSQERVAFRHQLIGLLLPREHNKPIVEVAAIVPSANRQALHHFLHDAPSRRRGPQSPPARTLASAPVSASACRRGAHRGRDR